MKKWLENKSIQFLIAKNKLDLKSLKTGLIIGLGILLTTWGIFALYKGYSERDTYREVDSSNDVAIIKLEQMVKSKQDMTIVLYRHDCKYCQNIEKPLVKELKEMKKGSYLVIDIQSMDNKQLKKLSEIVPEILVDGDKIPTPLIANVKGDGKEKLNVEEQVADDNMDKISSVLEKREGRT